MKNYLRKLSSYALLPAVLAGYMGIGSLEASENQERKSQRHTVDIENSTVVFPFKQVEEIIVKYLSLEPGINYTIKQNKIFSRKSDGLGSIEDHLNRIAPSYPDPEGREYIKRAIKLLDIVKTYGEGGEAITEEDLARYAEFASDGVITHEEYLQLRDGSVFVSDSDDGRYRTFHNGIIISVNHQYDSGYFESEKEAMVEETRLEEKVREFKPSEDVLEEEIKKQEKEKWSAVKKWALGSAIIGGVALALKYLGNKKDEREANGIIGGGPVF